eukprot:TRINITY_DN2741_c0_g1_i2.p1 TRINITY_DN2741_c0_g1~~TRINITY_DN2741_c0_g1_i2.p1  ORF type:complete len:561 (+),score=73.47 TRINITY_DN2741_c0_g1_i2:212-1894(+)
MGTSHSTHEKGNCENDRWDARKGACDTQDNVSSLGEDRGGNADAKEESVMMRDVLEEAEVRMEGDLEGNKDIGQEEEQQQRQDLQGWTLLRTSAHEEDSTKQASSATSGSSDGMRSVLASSLQETAIVTNRADEHVVCVCQNPCAEEALRRVVHSSWKVMLLENLPCESLNSAKIVFLVVPVFSKAVPGLAADGPLYAHRELIAAIPNVHMILLPRSSNAEGFHIKWKSLLSPWGFGPGRKNAIREHARECSGGMWWLSLKKGRHHLSDLVQLYSNEGHVDGSRALRVAVEEVTDEQHARSICWTQGRLESKGVLVPPLPQQDTWELRHRKRRVFTCMGLWHPKFETTQGTYTYFVPIENWECAFIMVVVDDGHAKPFLVRDWEYECWMNQATKKRAELQTTTVESRRRFLQSAMDNAMTRAQHLKATPGGSLATLVRPSLRASVTLSTVVLDATSSMVDHGHERCIFYSKKRMEDNKAQFNLWECFCNLLLSEFGVHSRAVDNVLPFADKAVRPSSPLCRSYFLILVPHSISIHLLNLHLMTLARMPRGMHRFRYLAAL